MRTATVMAEAESPPTDVMGVVDYFEARTETLWEAAKDARDAAQLAMAEITALRQAMTKVRIAALVKMRQEDEG